MNLNTSTSRAESRRSNATKRNAPAAAIETRKTAAGLSGSRTLSTTLKNIDRLQRDIENSFRDAKSQLVDSQGSRFFLLKLSESN